MAQKKRAKKSKKWFTKVRGSYLPNSRQGWLSYIPYTLYLLVAMVFALHYKHPTGSAVLIILPFWLAGAVLMTWFAERNS